MKRGGVDVAFWIWGKGDGVWSDGEEERTTRRMEVVGGEGWAASWIGRREGSFPFYGFGQVLAIGLQIQLGRGLTYIEFLYKHV
ncbi:hypothetical protein DsansV1_C15g0136661 [Dioscorea sansibarensis]